MKFSIVGYWKTKHTQLTFPVISSDELQSVEDFNNKVSTLAPSDWYNDSTLGDIKGTIYGDLLALALNNKPGEFKVVRTISDNKGNSAFLGTFRSPAINSYSLTVGKSESWTGNDTMSFYNIDTDSGKFPGDNKNIMILYLPIDKKLFAVYGYYTIGGNKKVTIQKIYNYSYTWITELSMDPSDIDSSNGDFILGPLPPDNPYGPGGDSGTGGGDGTFDDGSDLIPIPSLPTLSSADTGFTRIYNPTLSQVQDLANYLWTDESVVETIWNKIKQFFENPMDAIIGFNLVPVPVPNGGTENFKLMYIDTGVSMTTAANQFVDVDCGTLDIKLYYGSALDYSPYTKISCFLPFIGNVTLSTDEVMGRTLHVIYRVDICSGSCVAYILVDGNAIYQYSGHCAIPIPLSSADFSSYVNAAISVAKLAGAALSAGAGAAMASLADDPVQQTNQVVTTTKTTTTARNPATGRQITTGTVTQVSTKELPTKDESSTEASFAGITQSNLSNTVGQIMSSKPHIEHSGSFSGNSGYLGVRRPFVIIERPNMCMPANYQTFNGFPCMITLELGSCKGFTRVQQVQLTGLGATNPEQAEILQMLKAGVIL